MVKQYKPRLIIGGTLLSLPVSCRCPFSLFTGFFYLCQIQQWHITSYVRIICLPWCQRNIWIGKFDLKNWKLPKRWAITVQRSERAALPRSLNNKPSSIYGFMDLVFVLIYRASRRERKKEQKGRKKVSTPSLVNLSHGAHDLRWAIHLFSGPELQHLHGSNVLKKKPPN